MLEKDKWHIKGHLDGACLLKVIVSLAYIDAQETSAFTQTELTQMDAKIASLNFDIKKFNVWVKGQVTALAAHGKMTSDLIVNLFKGYKVIPNCIFKDYIEQKKMKRLEQSNPKSSCSLLKTSTKVKSWQKLGMLPPMRKNKLSLWKLALSAFRNRKRIMQNANHSKHATCGKSHRNIRKSWPVIKRKVAVTMNTCQQPESGLGLRSPQAG
jgi:hypothetical protein